MPKEAYIMLLHFKKNILLSLDCYVFANVSLALVNDAYGGLY